MVTIVLAASKECEEELVEMGFKQDTVWIHRNLAHGNNTAEQKADGDRRMFAMKKKPFQFFSSSWWGMGAD